jgi:hypothetical protein
LKERIFARIALASHLFIKHEKYSYVFAALLLRLRGRE